MQGPALTYYIQHLSVCFLPCRGPPNLELLPAGQRMSASDLKDSLSKLESINGKAADAKRILDVRPREQFDIAHLPGASWQFNMDRLLASGI